jgi:hypothetical protein
MREYMSLVVAGSLRLAGGLVRFVSGRNAVGFSGELDMAFLNAKAEFNDLNDPIFIYTVNLV